MNQKQKFLILDTETVGEITAPLVYDVGAVVTDRDGNIYATYNAIVGEVFLNPGLMNSAYYIGKLPIYRDKILNHEVEIKTFRQILTDLDKLIEVYRIDTLAAYNLAFDRRAMSNTCKWLFDNENFFKANLNELCIMCAACDILYKKKYCRTAREKGWVTEKGNIKTSAECGYRYITHNDEFNEDHLAMYDAMIESQILKAVFDQHKPFDKQIIAFPMRKVWKREG